MKHLRNIMLAACAMLALAATAQQPDPIISSITDAYRLAKESVKKNKSLGNEMVATFGYTVRGNGKSNEKVHFYYNTVEGTYVMSDNQDPHFFYYPLYFVTRDYNIGKKKYHEEYLFDDKSQQLLFAITQDYDENGNRFDRQFYFQDGEVYNLTGPAATQFMQDCVIYQADELRHAFDWLIRNPKE